MEFVNKNQLKERAIIINGATYTLILTCSACPEQYDVLLDGKLVGYLRLRHGYFAAYALPNNISNREFKNMKDVYESYTIGDGMFDDAERDPELKKSIVAIDKFVGNN
jgi:hypothetical protein